VVNGAEAVTRCCRESFDLILMDIQMPVRPHMRACGAGGVRTARSNSFAIGCALRAQVMDGMEATRAIREVERQRGDGRHIPIIAASARHARERDRALAVAR
jgi:CheY-like chemotaxis protein